MAVIGPNAADKLLGGYSGEPESVISILEGVQSAAGEKLVIEHAEGVQITRAGYKGKRNAGDTIRLPTAEQDKKGIAQAVAVASRADAILLVVGDNAQITREATMPTSPGDRSTLNLFGGQDLLVEAMIATGKPLIALLLNGRPLAVGGLTEKANALLEGWYLGQEGGSAFADVLFGHVNPSGKLPVSIPRSVGELPAFYNRHPSADKNTYIEAGKKRSALFPFGFGLSYTTFEISAPRLERAEVRAGEKLIFDVDVKNTGVREGSEVVQIYVRDDVSSVPRPVNELKAFRRVTLKAGQSRTLRFELAPEAFALWNRDMKRVVEPGMFTLSSGSSSEQLMPVKFRVIGQDLQI
ncbi:glycoside hydrolase family 3 C-terminal domain-containing protein [Sphingobium herbicidovorans]|uniref:glycoside hydrolase family 3 C-terminal domain-containing protein n=1 Tax=Sphingobium herbicidovorans TaxID=76947 RepID=UPI0022AFE87A|nr:glycoside hydrolase family 3 C-terminal domain-containing protein [Sphingobium herbicidovorans]